MAPAQWKYLQSAAGLLLLLAGAYLTPASARQDHNWRVIENSHFQALSDASPSDVEDLLLELERFRLIVQKLTTVKVPPDAPPVNVVIFNNTDDFRKYTPNNNVAGFATHNNEGHLLIVMPVKIERADSMHDIRHEYVHTLMAYHKFRFPRWYNEGLAEFLASVEMHDDEIIVGGPPKKRAQYWYYASLYSFDKLVADTIDPTRASLADAYMQYWLMTHYMLTDPKRAAKLGKYIALYNSGMDSLKAFKLSFGETPSEMGRRDLRIYTRHMKSYRMKFDFSGVDNDFSVRPARDQYVQSTSNYLSHLVWKQ